MSCKVHYYHRDAQKQYDLTSVVSEVEVFGTVDSLYRSARIDIVDRQKVKYENSERIRVYAEDKVIFDGRIFSVRNSARSGITLMCFDNAYYFKRFMANMAYRPVGQSGNEKGITLSDMIQRLARRANIEVDYIKPTTYEHGDINFANEDMQTIIQGLLSLEYERTGRRYYISMKGSKLSLRERGGVEGITLSNQTMFEADSFVDATDLYTKIRAYPNYLEDVTGSGGKPTGSTNLSSANYKGPNATDYQGDFRNRLKNTDQWDDLIIQVGNKHGVDPLMLKIIVMMESSGNPDLISSDGAGSMGLTQITPGNVGTYVNPARLFEPEYNLEMCCKILWNDQKLGAVKRRPASPSVKNMAHVWNSWRPDQGEDESPYANTFATVYKGFGGDPDMPFNLKVEYKVPNDKKTITDLFDVEEENEALTKRFGVMEKIVSLSVNSNMELALKVKELAKQLREDKTVSVECVGHPYAISGRKVEFQNNPVASGIWYIHSDTHIYNGSGYTMRLELTKYNETPEPEVPVFPPESEEDRPDPRANSNPDGGTGTFIRPAAGTITQRWGPASGANGYTFHNGVDIANAVGTKVVASDGGMIKKVRDQGGYGKHIVIVHPINQKRWMTLYAHLSKINVKEGQMVRQGDVIGLMGSTGNSTGSHLHFEIHNGDAIYNPHDPVNSVDPLKYI